MTFVKQNFPAQTFNIGDRNVFPIFRYFDISEGLILISGIEPWSNLNCYQDPFPGANPIK